MADCMMFPNDWHDFIKDYSFIDSEQVYTNGSELIQVFRITQLIEHLLKEQEAVEPKKENDGNPEPWTAWWYVCRNCGQPIDRMDRYCRECGKQVKWDE